MTLKQYHPIPTDYGYRADIRLNGRRYRKKFYHTRYEDAQQACQSYIDSLFKKKPAPTATLSTDLREYHRWSEQDRKKSAHWIRNCEQMLGEFVEYVSGRGVSRTNQITIEHLRSYRTWFASKTERTDATWAKYRQAFSAFFNWARKRDKIDANPAADEDFKIKVQKNPPETFERTELRKVIEYLSSEPPEVAAAFRFLFYTGARLGEMLKLTWDDVTLDSTPPVVVIGSKTKHKRRVPINRTELLPYLKDLPRDRRHVFSVASRTTHTRLQIACERVGVKRRPVHAIRHTFCRYLLEQGTEITLVSKLMGHLDIRTTMIYAQHFSLQNAESAVDSLKLW